jgi:zinc transporter ZupT
MHITYLWPFSESITSREEAASKPWGPVILATFIVNCAALTGLLLLLSPAIRKGLLARSSGESYSHGKLIDIVIPSFAVGALMATAFFLVLPEALHLIEGSHSAEEGGGADDHSGHNHRSLQDGDDHDDHGNDNAEGIAFAKWGCGILGGFLLPVFLSILFHNHEIDEDESALPMDEDECKSCQAENDIESKAVPHDQGHVSTAVVVANISSDSVIDADDEVQVQGTGHEQFQGESTEPIHTVTKTFINHRLGASILIGDAFHNFADGLFIGAAFLSCSWATALSITAVSLFHELAGELADFILLTRYVGFTPTQACVLNFTSGLAVCLGGITVLATQPSDEAIGILLAIAGGVYINIAACESMPRIDASSKERKDSALTLLSLIIGTIPIGLILLDHKHC